MKILSSFFLAALLLLATFANADQKAATKAVPKADQVDFQFVLVVTSQGQDLVIQNKDIDNHDFDLGEMKCKSALENRKDPVYPDQTLGTLTLKCKHGDFPIQSSVTCSLTDKEAQTHFEFGEGQQKFSFDLLCHAKAP